MGENMKRIAINGLGCIGRMDLTQYVASRLEGPLNSLGQLSFQICLTSIL